MLGFIGGVCKVKFIGQPCKEDPAPPGQGIPWDNGISWDDGTTWL